MATRDKETWHLSKEKQKHSSTPGQRPPVWFLSRGGAAKQKGFRELDTGKRSSVEDGVCGEPMDEGCTLNY